MANTTKPIDVPAGPFADSSGFSPFDSRIGGQRPWVGAKTPEGWGVHVSIVPNVIVSGRGVVPRDQLLPSRVGPQQVNVAGAGSVISLVYGRNRIGGKVMQPITFSANTRLLVPIMLGLGEFDGLESVEFDNRPPPGTVLWLFYPGAASQAVDPWLQAAWALKGRTYADTLPGIAWINVNAPNDQNVSFQSITVTVRGQKVYDPRDGTQSLTDPTTWKFSTNFALFLAHFLSAPGIGPEETLDWASVAAVANINDQIVGAGAAAEKRREGGIVFDQAEDVAKIEDTLRAHAGCWVVREAGVTRLVPDAPATSVFHFTTSKYRLDSLQIRARGRGRAPTVVTVQYTDTTSTPWKTLDCPTSSKAAGVDAGTTPWIESVVPMPGFQKPGPALREQIRRLNEFTLCDLEIAFIAMDEGAKVMVGDVFQISDNEGFSAKPFRCTDAFPVEAGRWQIKGSEYQDAVYSDSVIADPDIPDTSLPDIRDIAAPSNLVATSVVFFERDSSGPLATGFIYQNRGSCTVTPPSYSYPFGYRWELWDGTTKIDEQITSQPTYMTPIVQQRRTYVVNCYARSLYGPESTTPATASFTATGKTTPPNPVKAITYAQEIGGDVHVVIDPPDDNDVIRFEWRYTPNQTAGGSWSSALLINRVDSFAATFPSLPVGTHRLYVASIDAAGNYSTSYATYDVTVTTDVDAIIQSHDFAPAAVGGLTNMIAYPGVEGGIADRWITSVAGTTFNAGIPGTVNGVAVPIAQLHSTGTSKFVGEAWDLGQVVSAVWTLIAQVTVVNGVANYAIETSTDGVAYTSQPGLSVKADARFVRPVIWADSADTIRIDGKPRIQLASLAKPESGVVTTLVSGGALVAFAGKYSALQSQPQLTPINTSTATQVNADRILVYAQSGLMMKWTVSGATGTANAFLLQNIFGSSRVIQAGDFLEYDVWIDPSCPAAVDGGGGGGNMNTGAVTLHDATAGTYPAITDTITGSSLRTGAGLDVRGAWIPRRVDLTAFVGHTVDQALIGGDSDNNGAYTVVYRNIRFTNGSGTDRQAIWPPSLGGSVQTEPSANATIFSGLASNVKCGPANTMLVYAWNGTGASQVARDVTWQIKGY